MIVYGCGNCDGNRHNHDNLPVILAAAEAGRSRQGATSSTLKALANLYLSMADRLGLGDLKSFGDSTGALAMCERQGQSPESRTQMIR